MSPPRDTDWRGPVVRLAFLAHWDELCKDSTHCSLFVLTQAFDCDSKGGKKWLRSRPRPLSLPARQALSLQLGIVPRK